MDMIIEGDVLKMNLTGPLKKILPYILAWGLFPLAASAQYSSLAVNIEGPSALRICMTCHGAYGQGNPVVGGPRLAGMEEWYLRKQLENFRGSIRGTQLDYIPGYEMSKAVAHFSDTELNEIAAQVANWPAADVGKTVDGNPANGQTLYQTCIACHGAGGEGNEALGAPALAGRDDWYLLKQLKLFKSGYRGSHPDDTQGAQMRQMIQTLANADDMQDVVAYIDTLK